MIDTIYIQKKDGEFINETAFSMWYGCRLMGFHTVPFEANQIESLELSKYTLVHGWVGVVRKAFEILGVEEPHLDGEPPVELRELFGRKIWPTTMREIRNLIDQNRHIFIKPLRKQKAFNGHVTSGQIADLIQTAGFDDDFEILASEVVNFVSEYRLFINRGLIVGCRHYRGDFTVFPDFSVAYKCLELYQKAPISYSLDLGITDDGRTLPVELNDAFALGGYGLAPIPYAKLVQDRWEELTENVS